QLYVTINGCGIEDHGASASSFKLQATSRVCCLSLVAWSLKLQVFLKRSHVRRDGSALSGLNGSGWTRAAASMRPRQGPSWRIDMHGDVDALAAGADHALTVEQAIRRRVHGGVLARVEEAQANGRFGITAAAGRQHRADAQQRDAAHTPLQEAPPVHRRPEQL